MPKHTPEKRAINAKKKAKGLLKKKKTRRKNNG